MANLFQQVREGIRAYGDAKDTYDLIQIVASILGAIVTGSLIQGVLAGLVLFFLIGLAKKIPFIRNAFAGKRAVPSARANNPDVISFRDAPEQGSSDATDPELSWLHIEAKNNSEREIADCGARLHLEINEDGGRKGVTVVRDLVWRSLVMDRGEPRKTLMPGRNEFLPVVARNRDTQSARAIRFGAQGGVRVTDWEWFYGASNLNWLELETGVHRFKIEVHTGMQSWESEWYNLRVPFPGCDNGHFWLRQAS